jgi:hypothetical protein
VVGELFVGRITAATASAASENGHQACEAHFYSGAISMAGKVLVSAKRELSIARHACPKSFRKNRGALPCSEARALINRLRRFWRKFRTIGVSVASIKV